MSLIRPLKVHSQIVTFDLPVMLAATALLCALSLFKTIAWWWGFPLIFLLGLYTWQLIRLAKGGIEKRPPFQFLKGILSLLGVIVGLFLLMQGSDRLIASASEMARTFGISEFMIGLTIVAAGTSIPEMATSLVACYRKETDLAVGNIIGSNTYNILAILGISLLVSKSGIEVPRVALYFDLPFLFGVTLLVYPILLQKDKVMPRWQGALLVAIYAFYISWLAF